MMRRDPHPSSTAENSRFSMMAVTAIHQRLLNAEAKVGAMVGGGERRGVLGRATEITKTHVPERERERQRSSPRLRLNDHLAVKRKAEGRVLL